MENDDREPEEAAEPERGNNKKPNTTSLEEMQVISAILEGTIVENGKRVLPNKMASEIAAKIGKHRTICPLGPLDDLYRILGCLVL